jgi:hypothetical protein
MSRRRSWFSSQRPPHCGSPRPNYPNNEALAPTSPIISSKKPSCLGRSWGKSSLPRVPYSHTVTLTQGYDTTHSTQRGAAIATHQVNVTALWLEPSALFCRKCNPRQDKGDWRRSHCWKFQDARHSSNTGTKSYSTYSVDPPHNPVNGPRYRHHLHDQEPFAQERPWQRGCGATLH